MRQKRSRNTKTSTKVYHAPHMTDAGRRQSELEQELNEAAEVVANARRGTVRRAGGRIVAGAKKAVNPEELERQRLLQRLLAAEGRPLITTTVDSYLEAGFELPAKNQDVWLQLLEHNDEERVREAIDKLTTILDQAEPTRPAVLVSRLRRTEDLADEAATQRAAGELRRLLNNLG